MNKTFSNDFPNYLVISFIIFISFIIIKLICEEKIKRKSLFNISFIFVLAAILIDVIIKVFLLFFIFSFNYANNFSFDKIMTGGIIFYFLQSTPLVFIIFSVIGLIISVDFFKSKN